MLKRIAHAAIAVGLFLTPVSSPAAWTAPVTKSPTGKPAPKSSDAKKSADTAIQTCKTAMAAHPNPATVDEASYQTFIVYREWIDKLEPGLSSYDASVSTLHDSVPSKMLPACDKYFADYASGVGAAELPLSPSCERLVRSAFKLTASMLADVKTKGQPVKGARMAFARARYAVYLKYDGLYGRCATNDKFKKAFVPIKQDYDRMDADITAIESAKGLHLVWPAETLPSPLIGAAVSGGSTNGRIFEYVDARTGAPVNG